MCGFKFWSGGEFREIRVRGHGQKRFEYLSWEFVVANEQGTKCYTFDIKEHDIEDRFLTYPTTKVKFEEEAILRGLAEALKEMNFLPGDATTSELRATKYHLEDMRKLAKVKYD